MVEIRIREDSQGRLSSFLAVGHAGWAESGQDILCAAISTLLQAAWLGLSEYAGLTLDANKSSSEREGRLELRWPASARERPEVRAIVATTALSLERLALQYPDHLRVRREGEEDPQERRRVP